MRRRPLLTRSVTKMRRPSTMLLAGGGQGASGSRDHRGKGGSSKRTCRGRDSKTGDVEAAKQVPNSWQGDLTKPREPGGGGSFEGRHIGWDSKSSSETSRDSGCR